MMLVLFLGMAEGLGVSSGLFAAAATAATAASLVVVVVVAVVVVVMVVVVVVMLEIVGDSTGGLLAVACRKLRFFGNILGLADTAVHHSFSGRCERAKQSKPSLARTTLRKLSLSFCCDFETEHRSALLHRSRPPPSEAIDTLVCVMVASSHRRA